MTLEIKVCDLRKKGMSLREIGQNLGCAMETARQALLKADLPVLSERSPAPLPIGHPLVVGSMWEGLERWRQYEAQS